MRKREGIELTGRLSFLKERFQGQHDLLVIFSASSVGAVCGKKEFLWSAPVWYRPNTLRKLSQNYSHYFRVLERVKSCVPFFVRALDFYSSRA